MTAELPPEVVRGRHGWLLRSPAEFAELLHNALVVSVLLERRARPPVPVPAVGAVGA